MRSADRQWVASTLGVSVSGQFSAIYVSILDLELNPSSSVKLNYKFCKKKWFESNLPLNLPAIVVSLSHY